MTDPNRFKRPELERSEPVRSFRGMFGPPTSTTAQAAASSSEPPPAAVPLGVDLGYRVIEEYLQQGQAFARAVFPSGAPTGLPDPRKLNERLFKYASDLAAAWLEYVQALSGPAGAAWSPPGAPHAHGSAAGPAADGGNPFEPAARHPPSGRLGPFDLPGVAQAPSNGHAYAAPPAADVALHAPHVVADAALAAYAVTIDLASKKRAEVTVDLKPGALSALSAHELRAADPSLPRIGPVIIEVQPEQQRVVLRIAVPDLQPAAIYNALILDEATNLPRGTLSVRIAD
jgi:hypothetical protein